MDTRKVFVKLQPNDRAWNFDVSVEVRSGVITIQEGCFAFMITNTGDTIARLNGMQLLPGVPNTTLGDSKSLGGHKNDILKGILKLEFNFPTGAAPSVEIVQLYYTDYQ